LKSLALKVDINYNEIARILWYKLRVFFPWKYSWSAQYVK